MEFGVGTRKQRSGGKVQLSGLILKPWADTEAVGFGKLLWSPSHDVKLSVILFRTHVTAGVLQLTCKHARAHTAE